MADPCHLCVQEFRANVDRETHDSLDCALRLKAQLSQAQRRGRRVAKCRYHVPAYDDLVMGDHYPGTEADCPEPATHLSCMPYVGTPTCAEHSCLCAKPLPPEPHPPEEGDKGKSE